MKLHRFYIDTELSSCLVIKDKAVLHQWTRVLRFDAGREVELFNGESSAIYEIKRLSKSEAKLDVIKPTKAMKPKREIYLCFSLLKKDKNEWVLQKGTELGVSYFVPIISSRTEKTGWNDERAEKIVVEAAEQCGRTDVPGIISPTQLKLIRESLPSDVNLYVAEQSTTQISDINYHISQHIAVLIGPEGGWTDDEKVYFDENDIKAVSLSDFTLRAETAAITAVALLQYDDGAE